MKEGRVSYLLRLLSLCLQIQFVSFSNTYYCHTLNPHRAHNPWYPGGSLGWKTRGSLDPAFEKMAYDLEPSTTGSPKYVEVKTGFGYHIIMVEGRK